MEFYDLEPAPAYCTFWVSTASWELQCLTEQELFETLNEAILEGLEFKVQTIPF
jgi:hypothetical protein